MACENCLEGKLKMRVADDGRQQAATTLFKFLNVTGTLDGCALHFTVEIAQHAGTEDDVLGIICNDDLLSWIDGV